MGSKFYTLGELNLQINSGKSVGGAALTAGELDEQLRRRAIIIERIKSNASEKRADRVIAAVNSHGWGGGGRGSAGAGEVLRGRVLGSLAL